MNDEQWQETIGRIQDTFKVLDHEVTRGDEVSGDTERIEFETPQGKMKLERISKPRVVGKSTIGSKRIGGSVSVRYQYSSTDKISTVRAYRWDDQVGEWKEISAKDRTGPYG
ncbi:MAG: hypothetical protein HY420_01860 [Candidatus Kerfeldbacteria bacterium]|nr:hypothetical protein [Candidatus Kerfeldbacteria bacterium]